MYLTELYFSLKFKCKEMGSLKGFCNIIDNNLYVSITQPKIFFFFKQLLAQTENSCKPRGLAWLKPIIFVSVMQNHVFPFEKRCAMSLQIG